MANFSVAQQYFIDLLRSELSMRVQQAAGSSFILNAKFSDEELWEDFRLGLTMFNSYPPMLTYIVSQDLYQMSSSITLADPTAVVTENSESILISPIMMCSMFYAGLRLQWFEAGKHFRYNDNGISIERAKQADYNSIASSILGYIQSTVPLIKKAYAFATVGVKGQFSGTISYPRSLTRGLRGTRLGS